LPCFLDSCRLPPPFWSLVRFLLLPWWTLSIILFTDYAHHQSQRRHFCKERGTRHDWGTSYCFALLVTIMHLHPCR
jgi:hypothetical protein